MAAVIEQQQIIEDEWRGLYGESWTGVIVPEAFAHPAKFSRALIRHIYQHVETCGWIKPGDSVVDPFGGVALGAFDAMRHGLDWYGCELEEKFVGLGNENIQKWRVRYWHLAGWGKARLLQGDSRKLAEVLSAADCCVSSPPYSDGFGHGGQTAIDNARRLYTRREFYGNSEGQLGAMREGDLHLAISSPPYNPPMSQDHNGSRGGQRGTTPSERGAFVKYGNSEGQPEGMSMEGFDAAVCSPPFSHPETRDRAPVQDGSVSDFMTRPYTVDRQGQDERNLAGLPQGDFEVAVSSPPYEGSEGSPSLGSVNKDDWGNDGRDITARRGLTANYGNAEGQIGHTSGETFWSASRTVLEQLHSVIRPGGHAVFVVKAFVRNKQVVDFPAQWAQICEAVGFTLVHHHKALLVEHSGTQRTFHGEDKEITVERKSFFRRLAESKGSPRIDHESVLCFERR